MEMSINKGERCTVLDNSNCIKLSVVISGGQKDMVPGAIFTIPPPIQEAIDAAEKLKRQYERCIVLWQKKQIRRRQITGSTHNRVDTLVFAEFERRANAYL